MPDQAFPYQPEQDQQQPVGAPPAPGVWAENIAERIAGEPSGATELREIGDEIHEMVDADRRAREPWEKLAAKALRLMGVIPLDAERGTKDGSPQLDREGKAPEWWQSKVIHPMLGEALARYQAGASAEINPPEGPAKGSTIPDNPNDQLTHQSKRCAKFLNHIYTTVAPQMMDQTDRLLWIKGAEGTAYTKNAWDPSKGLVRCIIRMQDMWMPSHVETFDESPRHTHRMFWSPSKVKSLMMSGYLRTVDLEHKASDDRDESDADRLADAAIGLDREPNADTATKRDRPYEILETYIDYGFTGPGLPDEEAPYVLTMERTTQEVLRIAANWKRTRSGGLLVPWRQITPYYFLPGPHPGPYGVGIYHMVGALGESATVLLRSIMDAAAFHAHPSGFIEKAVLGTEGFDKSTIVPGEWRGVPLPIDDLRKAIMALPAGDIAPMFTILEFIVNAGQRFASTPDVMTGNADTRSPVGSILAMVEKGSEIPTSIHARMHRSATRELKLQAALIGEYIDPEAMYEWPTDKGENNIIARDFDGRVDVEPVSDPRVASQSHRLAQKEGVLQLTLQAPDLYDRREAHRRMLEALREGDIDKLLKPEGGPPRYDAVTEFARLSLGQPIQAWPDQDHGAHIVVFTESFKRLPLEGQKLAYPAYVAHLAEHVSLANRLQWEAAMASVSGQPVAGVMPPPPMAGGMPDDKQQPMDPQVERMIDALAAQAAQLMAQMPPPYAMDIGAPPSEKGAEGKAPDPFAEDKVAIDKAKAMIDATAKDAKAAHDEKLAAVAQANAMTAAHKVDQDAALEREKMAMQFQIAQMGAGLSAAQSAAQILHEDAQAAAEIAAGKADRAQAGEIAADQQTHEAGMKSMDQAHEEDMAAQAADQQAKASEADRAHQEKMQADALKQKDSQAKLGAQTTLKTAAMKPKPAAKPRTMKK